MLIDNILTTLVLIFVFFLLFFIGKIVHDLIHREYNLTVELVEKDNFALCLSIAGYYLGLVLAIGGAIVGPSSGIVDDILDLVIYGLLAIVLLNISWYLCDWFILRKFRISDELIRDQNQGTGVVSFGVSVASGIIVFGAVSGEGGNIWTAVLFWIIGQAILILSTYIYNAITPYDIHAEIEKDNVAAGVGFSGILVGIGIVVGHAANMNVSDLGDDVVDFIVISAFGLILLPLIRVLTDKVLLPTVKLTDEIVNQEVPNVGAAYIEASIYLASAFVISWCV